MALNSYLDDAWVGARHDPLVIDWTDAQGNARDLSGATITATIEPIEGGTVRAADGEFALVTDGSDGQFTWTFGEDDVAEAGAFNVQFQATFGEADFSLSPKIEWKVLSAQTVAA